MISKWLLFAGSIRKDVSNEQKRVIPKTRMTLETRVTPKTRMTLETRVTPKIKIALKIREMMKPGKIM